MKILIKKAKIIDAKSAFHNQIVDVKISNGIIEEIATNISLLDDYTEISLTNLHLSQGWFDSSVCFGEPGFEDSETIQNGLNVAAKSGFTAVALQPNTFPVIDNQSQIHFVKQKSNGLATSLFPIGAITKNNEGNELAELFDMKNAGAIAFGDYKKTIDNANLMKIALQYVQDFDMPIIAFCQDKKIKGNGVVNESINNTKLGLKGIPSLAEELIIARNLLLLEYTGGKIHIPTISTTKSVEIIREAKAKGLNVTCSVAVHNLVFTDQKLEHFNTNFKVTPPLRTNEDRIALLTGIQDNTIDCITTDHTPIDIEFKKVEFDLAKNGTIGLESAFSSLMNVLSIEKIVEKLTAAKSIFDITENSISIGNKAEITLFTTDGEWVFETENILSKSKNSAFIGEKMKGKVVGIYNNNQLILA
jgi:dihydroorotase